MKSDSVSWGGILLRIIGALVLVFLTWNPDGFSYWNWALAPAFGAGGSIGNIGPLHVLVGIALVIAWFVVLQATRRSLGILGAVLLAALCACVLWLLIDLNVVTAKSSRGMARAILIILGVLLGVGLSWSAIRGRLTGQVATDEVG
jgi:hypothetical protein